MKINMLFILFGLLFAFVVAQKAEGGSESVPVVPGQGSENKQEGSTTVPAGSEQGSTTTESSVNGGEATPETSEGSGKEEGSATPSEGKPEEDSTTTGSTTSEGSGKEEDSATTSSEGSTTESSSGVDEIKLCIVEGKTCVCTITEELQEGTTLGCEGEVSSYTIKTTIVSLDLSKFDFNQKAVTIIKNGKQTGSFETPDLVLTGSTTLTTTSIILTEGISFVNLNLQKRVSLSVATGIYLIDESTVSNILTDCNNELIGIFKTEPRFSESCSEVTKAKFTVEGEEVTRAMKGMRADTCERKDTNDYVQVDCKNLKESEIYLKTTLADDLSKSWKGVEITVGEDKLEYTFSSDFSVQEFVIGNNVFDLKKNGEEITVSLGKMTINPSSSNFLGSGITVSHIINKNAEMTTLFVSEGTNEFKDGEERPLHNFMLCEKDEQITLYRISTGDTDNKCTIGSDNEFKEVDCKDKVLEGCSTTMVLAFDEVPETITNTKNIAKYSTIDMTGANPETSYKVSGFTLGTFTIQVPTISVEKCIVSEYSVKEGVTLEEVFIDQEEEATFGATNKFGGFFYSNVSFVSDDLNKLQVSETMFKYWHSDNTDIVHTATVDSVENKKFTFTEFGLNDYVTDFSGYTLVIGESISKIDMTEWEQEYTFALFTVGKIIDIIGSNETLTIKQLTIGETVTKVILELKSTDKVNIESTNLEGKLITSNDNYEMIISQKLRSISLIISKDISETITEAGQKCVQVGEKLYWFNTNSNTCTLSDTKFSEEDMCSFFESYEKIELVLNTQENPSEDLESEKFLKCSFSDSAKKDADYSSINCGSFEIQQSIIIGNVDSLTVNCDKCSVVAKEIGTMQLVDEMERLVEVTASSVESSTFDFYGNVTTDPSGMNKFQLGDDFYFYYSGETKTEYKCPMTEKKTSSDETCNYFLDKGKISTEFIHAEISSTYTGSLDNTFGKCTLSTTTSAVLTITGLNCSQTEVKLKLFTFENCELGSATFTETEDSYQRMVKNSKFDSVSVSVESYSGILFYGSGNTFEDESVKAADSACDHARYFFGVEESTSECVYGETGFNFKDCENKPDCLELIINVDNYDSDKKFKTVNISSSVTNIVSISATTLEFTSTDSKLTIQSMTIDTLDLSEQRPLHINRANNFALSNVAEQPMIPYFVSNQNPTVSSGSETVGYSSVLNEEGNPIYRYYKTASTSCTCGDENKFDEWDCNDEDFNKYTGYSLVCDVETFTFNVEGRKFSEFTITKEECEYTNLNVVKVTVNSESKNRTFINPQIDDIISSGDVKVLFYANKELTNKVGIYSYQTSFQKEEDVIYRISTENQFYCTVTGEAEENAPKFAQYDCGLEGWHSPSSILTTNSDVLGSTNSIEFPELTFATIEFPSTVTEILINGNASLTKYQPKTGEKLTVSKIFTLDIASCVDYHVVSSINTFISSVDCPSSKGIIEGAALPVSYMIDVVPQGQILFVFKYTGEDIPTTSDAVQILKVSEIMYRISKGESNYCTYNVAQNSFEEFDCSTEYASNEFTKENMNLKFINYGETDTIEIVQNLLNSFATSTIPDTIKRLKNVNLKVVTITSQEITFEQCSLGSIATLETVEKLAFNMVSGSIDELVFDCGRIQEWNVKIGGENSQKVTGNLTLNENCEGKVSLDLTNSEIEKLSMETLFKHFVIKSSTIENVETEIQSGIFAVVSGDLTVEGMSSVVIDNSETKRYVFGEETNQYCTIEEKAYLEWDCQEGLVKDSKLSLSVNSSKVTLPKSVTDFNELVFDPEVEGDISILYENENPLKFVKYTLPTERNIYFGGSLTVSSVEFEEKPIKLTYVKGALTVTTFPENAPEYMFTAESVSGLSNDKSLMVVENKEYRVGNVAGLTEKTCTLVDGCTFLEGDCYTVNFDTVYKFTFEPSASKLVVTGTDMITYTCNNYEWKTFEPKGVLQMTGSLSASKVMFDSDNKNIVGTIAVSEGISFIQKEDNTEVERNVSVFFKTESVNVVVTKGGESVQPLSQTEVTPEILIPYKLLEGKLSGYIPSDINGYDCSEVYYYKTTGSTCTCPLVKNILSRETEGVFTGNFDVNCRTIQGDHSNVYTLEISDEFTSTDNIIYVAKETNPFVFSKIQVTKQNLKEITFQCAEGADSCSITFEHFAPNIRVNFIGASLTVYINEFTEGDSLSYIVADGANLATKLENNQQPTIRIPILSTKDEVYGISKSEDGSGSFTHNEVTYNRYYKTGSNILCDSTSLAVDCKTEEFSQYYTIDCSTIQRDECTISYNYTNIKFRESANPIKITSISPVELKEMNVEVPVIVGSNIVIAKFFANGKYTLFEGEGPKEVSVETEENYLFDTILETEYQNGISSENCSISEDAALYRFVQNAAEGCQCIEGSLMVDCEYHRTHFNYYITNKESQIDQAWKTLNIVPTLEFMPTVTLKEELINTFVVNEKPATFVKSQATEKKTELKLDFSAEKYPYIYIGDGVSISAVEYPESTEANLLFVQEKGEESFTLEGLSAVVCNQVVRVFNNETNVGCVCSQSEEDSFDNEDCKHLSSNYDFDCQLDVCNVDLSWNSITGSNQEGTKLVVGKNNDKINVKRVKQGNCTMVVEFNYDFISMTIQLIQENNFFLLKSEIPLSNQINIQLPDEPKSYYFTADSNVYQKLDKTKISGHAYAKKNTYYRIVSNSDTDIGVKCTLSEEEFSGPSDFNEPDCQYIGKGDESSVQLDYADFDLELTEKLTVASTELGEIKFNKLIMNEDITIAYESTSLSFELIELKNTLTLEGTSFIINSIAISETGTVIHNSTSLTITELTSNENKEMIQSYCGQVTITKLTVGTASADGTKVIGRASHANVEVVEETSQIAVNKYNGKTTINWNARQKDPVVVCDINQQGESFDEMFSEINCPCDTDSNCKINLKEDTDISTITLAKASIAQWNIPQDKVVTILFDEEAENHEIHTITTDSELSLNRTTKITALSGSGKVIINNDNDCEIISIQNKDIVTTGSSAVTMTLKSQNTDGYNIDCVNCNLKTSSEDVIVSSIQFGDGKTIVVENDHQMTIKNIDFNEGTIVPIVFNGASIVTLAPEDDAKLPTIPILIAENAEKVQVSDSSKYIVSCSSKKLFYNKDFIPSIYCPDGEDIVIDNKEGACVGFDYCVLDATEMSSVDLKAEYDLVKVGNGLTVTAFPSEMKTVYFECTNEGKIILENVNQIEVIKSDGCDIEIADRVSEKQISIYMYGETNTISSSENAKMEIQLMTNKFASLSIAGKVTINRDVEIEGDLTCGSLLCTSGSLTVTGTVTFSTSLEIASSFGVFEMNKLVRTKGTISAENYLLYSMKEYSGIYFVKSYLSTTQSTEKPHEYCYTTTSEGISLSNELNYLNHPDSGCSSLSSLEKKYIIKSKSIVIEKAAELSVVDCSSQTKSDAEIGFVTITGSNKLTINKLIGNIEISVESDITGDGSNDIKTYNKGTFKDISHLTVATTETVEVENCPNIEIERATDVTLRGTLASISINDLSQFKPTHDHYISVDSESELTVNFNGEGQSEETFILMKSDEPMKVKNMDSLQSASLKCNNRILCNNCEDVVYSCEEEEITDSGISYECTDLLGSRFCTAKILSANNGDRINTFKNDFQVDKLIVNVDVEITVSNIPSTVETIEVESGKVTVQDYIPTELIVSGSSEVTVQLRSDVQKEVSVQGSDGSTITFTKTVEGNALSFKKIVAKNLVLKNFKNLVVYGLIDVEELTMDSSTFDIYGNVDVEKLILSSLAGEGALFLLKTEVDEIKIGGFETTLEECVTILDVRTVSTTPTVTKSENIQYKDNLYFVNCEEDELQQVEICKLHEDKLNVKELSLYESSYYDQYSLCPDVTKTLDFSKSESNLHIYGIEEEDVPFKHIVLPVQSSLTTSTTNPVEIDTLEAQSVVFESKFYIHKLIVVVEDATSTPTLTFNDNVEIDSIEAQGPFNIIIENGAVVTINNEHVLTMGRVEIKGTTSVFAMNTTFTVTEMVVDCSRSESVPLIYAKQFILANSFSVSCIVGTVATEETVQSVVETIEDMSFGENAHVSLVCTSKTIVYPKLENDERYVCPTSYVCEKSVSECEQARGDSSKQQYIYHVSSDVTFKSNNEITTTTDVVIVDDDARVSVQLESGAKYLFILSEQSEITIKCLGDSTATCEVSVLGGTATLEGKGKFFDAMSISEEYEEDISTSTVLKLVDGSVFDFQIIEGMEISLELSGNAQMNVQGYANYKQIRTSGTSIVYVTETFDCSEFIYNGGEVIVLKEGAVAGLKMITIEHVNDNDCLTIIKPGEAITTTEQLWDGNVAFADASKTRDVYVCSKSQLSVCPSGKSVTCKSIECSEADREKRDICYCSYDPLIGQECVYKCDDPNGECSISAQMTRIPSFSSLSVPEGATLTITVPTIFQKLEVSSSLTIITEVSVYIHEIVDGTCGKQNGEKCTLTIQAKEGSETEIVIEKINMLSASSVLVIDAYRTVSQQIHIENAQFDVKTIIEIPEDKDNQGVPVQLIPYATLMDIEKKKSVVNDIVRELVFKKCTVTFFDASGIEVFGPEYNVNFTSKNDNVNAAYNKLTIESATMNVVGSYKQRAIPTVIYFDIVGTVSVKTLTGSFKATDDTERSYINLVQNNLPQYITAEGLSGNVKMDDQGYAMILVREGLDKSTVTADEISCSLRAGSYYQFDEMTKGIWDRGTCPCDKEGCVIDISGSTTSIEYDFTNRNIDKFVAVDADIVGSNIGIQEIVAQGIVNLKSHDVNTSTVTIGKNGEFRVNSKMNIHTVKREGEEKGGKLVAHGGNVEIHSMTGVDLMVGAEATLIFQSNSSANFKGQTITLEKGGQIDVYSDNIDFDETTTINVKFEADKLTQPISMTDSNTGGLTANIVKAHFVVSIPDESGKAYPLLRFRGSGLKNVKVDIVTDSSIKKAENGKYKIVEACEGIVITDLAADQITCPENPMTIIPPEKTFPIWIIIIVVIAAVVLIIIVVIFIIYLVQVMLQRRANMKVFNEGEEVELDLGQNDDDKDEEKTSGSQEGSESSSESSHHEEEKDKKSEKASTKSSSESESSSEKKSKSDSKSSSSESKKESSSESEVESGSGSGSGSGSEVESGSGSVSTSESD